MSQNILCINCNAIVHAEPCTVVLTQGALNQREVEPIVDPIVAEIEMTIAEMEHYQEMFNESKKKLKQLKKLVKHKLKAEIVAVKN